jgi:thioredoxin-like negative regulator of GroEL
MLLLAGFWWQQRQYSSPALADQYFTAYPDRLTTMSGDTEADLAAAMDAYNAGDYEQALALFRALPPGLPQADLLQLYRGITLLRAGQPDAARAELTTLPADSPYQEAARWYLALSELALGDEDSARQRLQAIVAEGAYPGPAAQALLDDLNSWWH